MHFWEWIEVFSLSLNLTATRSQVTRQRRRLNLWADQKVFPPLLSGKWTMHSVLRELPSPHPASSEGSNKITSVPKIEAIRTPISWSKSLNLKHNLYKRSFCDLQKCLLQLYDAPTDVDQIFIIYGALPGIIGSPSLKCSLFRCTTPLLSPCSQLPGNRILSMLAYGMPTDLLDKPLTLKVLFLVDIDIMLVSETLFYQDTSVKIANFRFFHVDRPIIVGGDPNGGIALYNRNGINATLAEVPQLPEFKSRPCFRIPLHLLAFPLQPFTMYLLRIVVC